MSQRKTRPVRLASHRFLALILVSLAVGIGIAWAVLAGLSEPIDRLAAHLLTIENLQAYDPRLREALRDFTALGSFPVLGFAVFATCSYLLATGRSALSAIVLISALSAAAMSTGLKEWLGRARPDFVEPVITTFTASFPSGHAFLSMSVYLSIGAFLAMTARCTREKAAILTLAFLLALAIGTSRIILGVHWLTDVVAGWCFGLAWAVATFLCARSIGVRATPAGSAKPDRQQGRDIGVGKSAPPFSAG